MGAAWINRGTLVRQTAEVIGYKAGLALTHKEFNEIIPPSYREIWNGPNQEVLRIRAEDFDELIAHLLYVVGNTSTPDRFPALSLTKKYMNMPDVFPLYKSIHSEWVTFLSVTIDKVKVLANRSIDPTPFIKSIEDSYGLPGVIIAIDLMKSLNAQMHVSPFSNMRHIEWKDIAELKGLFNSRCLDTQYGTFFDQRFIDFLGNNFERIGEIHWRKFEGLTCEFFERHGYFVEIGPGSDDDGVDARVWLKEPVDGKPPLILVQCKRRKDKVDKGVVKALYADILYEKAERGLIVTSRSLSPGADEVRIARSYPIEQADRATLKKWIDVMRSPGTGIFM